MAASKTRTNGKIPHADPRIVVKFKEHHATIAAMIAQLERNAAGVRFVPFAALEPELRAASQAPFDRYAIATVSDRAQAEELARRLQALQDIDVAYVESGPAPPPSVNPADDTRFASQGYLTAAPDGIDAIWAWSFTDGDDVGFVDLEQGWMLNHEDLATANITLISGLNQAYQSHGTSVLGEVLAVDNTVGDVGIAPRAGGRVVSEWRNSTTFSTAAAILSAAQVMSRGDVLLIESQTSPARLPRETEALTFDAIRHAIDNDHIVVVEAAGNGATDLDAWTDTAGRHTLDRNSNDFRDSGAILVGAASSTAPHARLNFSNYGSRIDCYAWGENIDTLDGASTSAYTGGFNGTSGASPIVAGAAVLINCWKKRQSGAHAYASEDMRDLLGDTALNTASANPASDRIGVMPNLRAIFESLDRWQLRVPRYAEWVYILLGLIDDSPGVIWIPGKGPVPVDPGWGKRMRVPDDQRDLLTALTITEIVSRMQDAGTRDKLRGAALDAMRGAVERMGRMQ